MWEFNCIKGKTLSPLSCTKTFCSFAKRFSVLTLTRFYPSFSHFHFREKFQKEKRNLVFKVLLQTDLHFPFRQSKSFEGKKTALSEYFCADFRGSRQFLFACDHFTFSFYAALKVFLFSCCFAWKKLTQKVFGKRKKNSCRKISSWEFLSSSPMN